MSAPCHSALGVFKNACLRMIENDKEFTYDEIMEEEGKTLSEYTMQAIKNKETNDASDASVKDEHVAGV